MKRWKDHHSDRDSPLSFPAAWKAIDACNSVLERAQNVNATFDILADLSEHFTPRFRQSIQPSGPITTSTTRGTSPLPMTSLIVGPDFKANPSLYLGFPLNPDAHVPRTPFIGARRSSSASIACSSSIDWFYYTSSRRLATPQIISWRSLLRRQIRATRRGRCETPGRHSMSKPIAPAPRVHHAPAVPHAHDTVLRAHIVHLT